MLEGYFHPDGRPLSVEVQLPRVVRDDSAGGHGYEHRTLAIPLLSLVGGNRLGIQKAEVELDVSLAGVEPEPTAKPITLDPAEGRETQSLRPRHNIRLDVGGARKPESSGLVKVRLEVAAQPPPEGLSRLISHLQRLL